MTLTRTFRALAMLAVCASSPVLAQDAARGDWTFRATMYAWLPSIHSTSQTFDASGGSIVAEVNPDGYLSHVKFVFMGTLEARNGPWSLAADALYLHMGDVKTRVKGVSGPGGILAIPVEATAETTTKGFVGTLVAGYALPAPPDSPADIVVGVRHARLTSVLDWRFAAPVTPIGAAGTVEASKNFTDGIVGVRGRASLGGNWFVPYHLDAGAGSSRSTWQAFAGVGYRYGWGDVTLAYRHLAYDFKSDRPMADLRLSGPQLGASFTF